MNINTFEKLQLNEVKELILKGNREEIREKAADIAINEALQLIL